MPEIQNTQAEKQEETLTLAELKENIENRLGNLKSKVEITKKPEQKDVKELIENNKDKIQQWSSAKLLMLESIFQNKRKFFLLFLCKMGKLILKAMLMQMQQ